MSGPEEGLLGDDVTRFLFIICAATAVLLLPRAALAWGPGVHLMAGNFVLANADLLPRALAGLLPAWRDAFLYGCLSADIFVGKGSRLRPGHSHDWDVAFAMLGPGNSAKLQAYAFGYLTHLAADVVAHNYYVPNMLARTPATGTLSHVYLEMQADRMIGWDPKQARALFKRRNAEADRLLLASTGKNRSLFLLRKKVFRQGLVMSDQPEMRQFLVSADKMLPRVAGRNTFAVMFDLTLRVVMDFLHHPQDAPVLAYDPTGGRRLRQVKRMMRRRRQQGLPRPVTPLFTPDPLLVDLPSLDEFVRLRAS